MTLHTNDDPYPQTERPDGLTPDEWEAVQNIRKRKAEEAKIAEHWAVVVVDLDKASPDGEEKDWDVIAGRFRARVERHGWGEDKIAGFTSGLMRGLGFFEKAIRNYGWGWAPTRLR
jgi:hypothetical protein